MSAEIGRIEGPEKQRQKECRAERVNTYIAYFTSLKSEQEVLEELYSNVSMRLASNPVSSQEQPLEFSVKWEARIDEWLKEGADIFDQRKTLPFGDISGIESAAKRILLPAWTSGDTTKVEFALKAFLAEFRKPENLDYAGYLRSGHTLEDLLVWLYKVDHICLTYGLKYNGVDLDKLSPGTKGIVLLILYLGLDTADTRPLLVDQPDENLDNESIYSMLTAYFKEAKKRRQVIMITHNPNLVVNGDSEQVIVASCTRRDNGLPHISYCSGPLEDADETRSAIRQQICRILEGGPDAFLRREKRYSLADPHIWAPNKIAVAKSSLS